MSYYPDDLSLDGRRALVTGASTGIGAAIAARLRAAGAEVVGASRRGIAPDGVVGIRADLLDDHDVDHLVDRTVAELGGLDILVNNAGGAEWRQLEHIDRTYFDQLMGLNVWVPLRLAQKARRWLQASGTGAMVMIGSVDAVRPSAGAAVYGATKAGLGAITITLAKEWMDDGIRVNQINPGLVDTPLAAEAVEQIQADGARINLAGRVGMPEEIAALAHLLVAPAGGFINGACLPADGGALVLGPFDLANSDPHQAPNGE